MSIASPKHHTALANSYVRNLLIQTATTPRSKSEYLVSPSLTNITVKSTVSSITTKSGKSKRYNYLSNSNDDESIASSITAQSARDDLLAIGIDIDERTIERMQAMGIEKVFEAANSTAEVIKSKNKNVDEVTPILRYRGYDPPNKTTSYVGVPFQLNSNDKDNSKVDIEKIQKVLTHLTSISSDIHPPTKLVLERLLQHLRVQYFRSPGRFIKRLLGLPSNKSDKYIKDYSRLIVNTRLVDFDHFIVMIHRLRPDIHPSHIQSLFQLLSEEKIYSIDSLNKVKINVVDIWLFLSLLQTSSEESRRQYDMKNSNLSHMLEFWDKYIGGDEIKSNIAKPEPLATFENNSVASVLGHNTVNLIKLPKSVNGTYFSEVMNKGDVAEALNFPKNDHKKIIRRQKSQFIVENSDNVFGNCDSPKYRTDILLREQKLNQSVKQALNHEFSSILVNQNSHSKSLKELLTS